MSCAIIMHFLSFPSISRSDLRSPKWSDELVIATIGRSLLFECEAEIKINNFMLMGEWFVVCWICRRRIEHLIQPKWYLPCGSGRWVDMRRYNKTHSFVLNRCQSRRSYRCDRNKASRHRDCHGKIRDFDWRIYTNRSLNLLPMLKPIWIERCLMMINRCWAVLIGKSL